MNVWMNVFGYICFQLFHEKMIDIILDDGNW